MWVCFSFLVWFIFIFEHFELYFFFHFVSFCFFNSCARCCYLTHCVLLCFTYTYYIESNSMRNVCERARSWIQSLNEMAYINRYGFPSTPSSLSAHLCLSLSLSFGVYFVVNFSFCLFSILCRYDMVVVAYLPNGRSFHAHTIVFALFVSPEKECVHIAVYFFFVWTVRCVVAFFDEFMYQLQYLFQNWTFFIRFLPLLFLFLHFFSLLFLKKKKWNWCQK